MKSPCRSFYDSVYDGVDIEMHIVDHCNLNCANCNHFSPLSKQWYIDLDNFKSQLLLLKIKIPSLRKLMLLGGEPTLHPDLLAICESARSILGKNIIIEVLTNGKDLKPVLSKLDSFKQIGIKFIIGNYNLSQEQKDLANKVVDNNCGRISWGKEFFQQTLVDPEGNQPQEQFYHGCHHRLPCFTLKNYKIYECPFSAHLDIFCDKFNVNIPDLPNDDYLDLNNLTLDALEEFSYKPKNRCKYCKQGDFIQWNTSTQSFDEFNKTLIELYHSNYTLYLKLINNKLDDDIIYEQRDKLFADKFSSKYYKRFYDTLIDIIIPYYNDIDDRSVNMLLDNISKQTIIDKCHLIFVSDFSDQNIEDILYNNLNNKFSNLNYTMLRTESNVGPGLTRNVGIDNSCGKYIFFLDSSDGFISSASLEQLLFLAESNNLDIVESFKYDIIAQKPTRIVSALYRSDFIKRNNLKFSDIPIYEDALFHSQARNKTSDLLILSKNFINYNIFNEDGISSNYSLMEKQVYKEQIKKLLN